MVSYLSVLEKVLKPIIAPIDSSAKLPIGGSPFHIAMAMAMSSVAFEAVVDIYTSSSVNFGFDYVFLPILTFCIILYFFSDYKRASIVIFSAAILLEAFNKWNGLANHGWLALWCIPVASIFSDWTNSRSYSQYLRLTLGVVMLAAAAQKILAGTYLDGTYIAYMSSFGSPTERMFGFMCSSDASLNSPCALHIGMGIFIVLWQILVGVLLIAGVKSLIFLFIEVGFLFGAGVYADEMNFQVLNISLLCIAFRVGMSYWLAFICATLLAVDVHGIGRFVEYAFP